MQFPEAQKQSAGTEGASQGIHFPYRFPDFQGLQQTRFQIGEQIASRPFLDQDSCEIRTHVGIDESGARSILKGLRQRVSHPVLLLQAGPFLRHEAGPALSEAHGEGVPHRSLLQVLRRFLREISGKGVGELFLQGEQSLLDGKAHGGGHETLSGGIDVPPDIRLKEPLRLLPVCRHPDPQHSKSFGILDKLSEIHSHLFF